MFYLFGGMYMMFYIFLFPVWPITYVGWYVGGEIIQMNIVKWVLSALMFYIGYFVLANLDRKKGRVYLVGFIVIEYLIADVMTLYLKAEKTDLVVLEVTKKIIDWSLSNS